MANFPSISVVPEEPYSETQAEYSDLKSPVEAGYKVTRQRFTRTPKTYKVLYKNMTDADYTLLVAFITAQGTTGNWNWTHPTTAATHDVRFVKRPELKRVGLVWSMECELEEV